jgi:hypothetical protein
VSGVTIDICLIERQKKLGRTEMTSRMVLL